MTAVKKLNTSTIIYKESTSKLQDFLIKKKFKRIKGSFPGWTKKMGDKFLTFWFQCARQGGQLTIEFQYSDKPVPGTAKWNQRERIFKVLDKNVKEFEGFTRGNLSTQDDYWFEVNTFDDINKIIIWFQENLDRIIKKFVDRYDYLYQA